MQNITAKEFNLMRDYIEKECGIALGKDKSYLIESRLSGILAESGLPSFGALYYNLGAKKDPRMRDRVIDAITTNETLWFRDKTPWETMEDILLPIYIDEIKEGKRDKVRIWSAATSTGQEAYSTLMAIDNYLREHRIDGVTLDNFDILATDISQSVLKIARAGKYDSISIMRGLDPMYRDKYFTKNGRSYQISKKLIDRVKFRQFNLQNSFISLGKFDIVFCRYVAIYFSAKFKEDLFNRIARTLYSPQGVLFLGSSEVFTGYEPIFTREQHQGGVYYRVREMGI